MDDYGNDNDSSIYGSSDQYNEGDLDGFQIDEGFGDEMSAEELIASYNKHQEDIALTVAESSYMEREADNTDSHLVGMATAATLQQQRISEMEPRIQAGIKHVLEGGNLPGTDDPLASAVAREAFASTIGGDPAAFAKSLKVDGSVGIPRHRQDQATVLSMLGKTAEPYMQRGPGGSLAGMNLDEESRLKQDQALQDAMRTVSDLADLYIDDRTRGTRVESARRQAIEQAIYKRMLDGTSYEGAEHAIPLPNELYLGDRKADGQVTGTKVTRSKFSGAVGTGYDRLSHAEAYASITLGYNNEGRMEFVPGTSKEQIQEYYRTRPNLKESLFPTSRGSVGNRKLTEEQRQHEARTQEYQFNQMLDRATAARKVLREQMPTLRDESKGQMRMTGFDRPYGDQAYFANLRDEAARLGMDWKDKDTELSTLTDVDLFVEEQLEEQAAATGELSGSPKQGTAEWLAQRRGKITASQASVLVTDMGAEKMAARLARERLGLERSFQSNAHMREGNVGEAKVANAFMAGPGAGLTIEEAFFEENPMLPGFGISPDARLYNEDGSSAGLAEFKYLSTGSMQGAVKKYTPQMQLQMAVTGEKRVHFYALDKYTGDFIHEVVEEDKEIQGQLIKAGKEALQMQQSLTAGGIQSLEQQIRSQRKSAAPQDATGQTKSFEASKAGAEAITPFRGAPMTTAQVIGAAASARARNEQEARDRVWDDSDPARIAMEQAEMRSEADQQAEQAARGFKQALKESTGEIKEFGGAVANAAVSLANIAVEGNASAMDTMRAAAEAGMSADEARGLEFAMVRDGGMTLSGARATIASAGQMQRKLMDVTRVEATYTDMATKFAGARLGEKGANLPSIEQLRGMNSKEYIAFAQEQINAVEGPAARRQVAEMFGVDQLAFSNTNGENLAQAGEISEEEQRSFYEGLQTVSQTAQELKEAGTAKTGKAGGVVAGGIQQVAGNLGGAAKDLTKAAAALTAAAGSLHGGKISKFKGFGIVGAAGAAGYMLYQGVTGGVDGLKDTLGLGPSEEDLERMKEEEMQALSLTDFDIKGALPTNKITVPSQVNPNQTIELKSNVEVSNTIHRDGTVETEINDNGERSAHTERY